MYLRHVKAGDQCWSKDGQTHYWTAVSDAKLTPTSDDVSGSEVQIHVQYAEDLGHAVRVWKLDDRLANQIHRDGHVLA